MVIDPRVLAHEICGPGSVPCCMAEVDDARRQSHSSTCNRITDAIRTASAIPDGWKLAPIEPTEEMEIAYEKVKQGFKGRSLSPNQTWGVMLAAAPQPPKATAEFTPTSEMMKAMAVALCLDNGDNPDEMVHVRGRQPLPRWTTWEKEARAAWSIAIPMIAEECAKVADEASALRSDSEYSLGGQDRANEIAQNSVRHDQTIGRNRQHRRPHPRIRGSG